MDHERKAPAVVAAAVVIGVLAGAALGVVWWRLAPRAALVVGPDSVAPEQYQPREWLAADVTFAAIAILAGIVATIALARMRRGHLLTVLASAILAGAIGSAVMAFVGQRLGSVDIEGLQATLATDPAVVEGPLEVTMPAVLLTWPVTAAAVVTAVAFGDWLAERRRARPRRESGPSTRR